MKILFLFTQHFKNINFAKPLIDQEFGVLIRFTTEVVLLVDNVTLQVNDTNDLLPHFIDCNQFPLSDE